MTIECDEFNDGGALKTITQLDISENKTQLPIVLHFNSQ